MTSAKVYTTKSNAIRAAKSAGQDPATVYATEGGFSFPAAAPATTSNPAGWETAGGPTDQDSAPASATTEPVPYTFNEGTNSAGEPAGGPANDSGTPLSDLVDEPPVVLRAKRVTPGQRKTAKAARKAAPAKPAKAESKAKPGRKPKAEKKPAEPKAPRDTKLSRFVAMLQRPEGCTLDDAMDAFGWQRHTARGAIAGAIKVKLGHKVETEKVDGKTVYRIPA